DPWGFAPGDPPLVFSKDLDATCASIEAACGAADADAYRRFVEVWGPRSRAVVTSFGARPAAGPLLRAFWPLGAPRNGRPRTPGPGRRPAAAGQPLRPGRAGADRRAAVLPRRRTGGARRAAAAVHRPGRAGRRARRLAGRPAAARAGAAGDVLLRIRRHPRA